MTTPRYVVIAINDEQDTCDCCGKKGLKRVVWLHDTIADAEVAYGTTCAARANKWTVKDQNKAIRNFVKEEYMRLSDIIEEELKDFSIKARKVLINAPKCECSSTFLEDSRLRRSFIAGHPDTIAYEAKRLELSEKYNRPVWNIK